MIETNAAHFKSIKILEFETAAKKISELKKANKIVGLCHGGFDLLHPGHIKHLESAAKLCDCLFVSITSDIYVSSRKGCGRPIFSDLLRAYAVASIQYVDYVVVSDFELATEVIEKLVPSYYIKGPDFISKTTSGITAERSKIEALGGKIKYTTDHKLSTTEIIRYIQENLKREKVLLVIDRDGTLIRDIAFIGKEEYWKGQIELKEDVLCILIYAQAKYETVKVVISNQQGVARGYFDAKTVMSINKYVDSLLREKGIVIDNWQYCPDVDTNYAASIKGIKFKPDFIKHETRRKPSPEMLFRALQELRKNKEDFDKIIIIGNSQDDAAMAKNINAKFIDVTNKDYRELKTEFDRI